MQLKDIWEGSVKSYLIRVEALGMEESSLVWKLSRLTEVLHAGDPLGTIRNQELHGCEEVDMYAVGGVGSFDIYNTRSEKLEYYKDVRAIKKNIYLT